MRSQQVVWAVARETTMPWVFVTVAGLTLSILMMLAMRVAPDSGAASSCSRPCPSPATWLLSGWRTHTSPPAVRRRRPIRSPRSAKLKSPRSLPSMIPPHWTPDGKGIAYVEATTQSNLWFYPLDGTSPRQLTNFPDDGLTIADYAWSADGKRFAVGRAALTQNIVLIRGLKKAFDR